MVNGYSRRNSKKISLNCNAWSKALLFGGKDQLGQDLNTVDIYDTETGKWERGVSGGNPRSFHSSLLQEGRIYNIAGNTSGITSSVDIFIPEVSGDSLSSSIWSNGVSGGRNRESHSSLTYGDSIYYWGGVNDTSQIINTLDIYNTSNDSWTEGLTGGRKRKDHRGFIYKDKLFFHGGQDDSGLTTNSMDIYKPDSEVWAKGIRGGRKRKNHAMVEANGRIYSWGGQDELGNALNSLDVYNLDPWLRGVSGGDGRTDHNAISVDGKMYIWNGFGTGNFINNVDVYDLENRTWIDNIDTPTLLDPKSGASSCIMSGTSNITTGIYFWGGDGGQNPNKIQVYDLANQQFITTGPIVGENREYASANCYNGKVYIWGGRPASGIATNQLDIFDVSTQQLDTGSQP